MPSESETPRRAQHFVPHAAMQKPAELSVIAAYRSDCGEWRMPADDRYLSAPPSCDACKATAGCRCC